MTDVSSRVASLVLSTIASLRVQYETIGLGAAEQSMLLAQLEEQLVAKCDQQQAEATAAVQALQADIDAQIEAVSAARAQLGLAGSAEVVSGPLQVVLAAQVSQLAALSEQRALHVSALSGDLARLQTELYPKLDVPVCEVTEFMEAVDVNTSDLSAARIKAVEQEVARMESLWSSRVSEIIGLISEMSGAWSRLGLGASDVTGPIDERLFEPTDKINSTALPPMEPTASVIAELRARGVELARMETKRTGEIDQKRTAISALHRKLQASPETVKQFEAQCAHHANSAHPLSANVLGFYGAEASRLEILKQARLQSLVFEVRVKLSAVYAELHMTQSEQSAFRPLQSTVYTDFVLEAHEAELERAQARLATVAPLFKEVAKWTAMKEELATFELSSADPTRFQARNAHVILKAEEKMRKKRDVQFPALEIKLQELLDQWQTEHPQEGEFKMDGVSVLDQVRTSVQAREEKAGGKKSKTIDTGAVAKIASSAVAATPSKPSAVMATPAKTARPATAAAAATPSTTQRAAPTTGEKTARPASAISSGYGMTTPLKKSSSNASTAAASLATPLPSIPSTPLSATAATPVIRAPVARNILAPSTPAQRSTAAATQIATPSANSRIPAFGTTSSMLTTVARQQQSKENGPSAGGVPTPTPSPPTVGAAVVPASRPALGEIRLPQQTAVEETTLGQVRKAAPLVVAVGPIPIAEEDDEEAPSTPAVVAPTVPTPTARAAFMKRFTSALVSCASESEQLEVFLGPLGLGANPAPEVSVLSQLLRMRAGVYARFGTPEDAQLAEADRTRADMLEEKTRSGLTTFT